MHNPPHTQEVVPDPLLKGWDLIVRVIAAPVVSNSSAPGARLKVGVGIVASWGEHLSQLGGSFKQVPVE